MKHQKSKILFVTKPKIGLLLLLIFALLSCDGYGQYFIEKGQPTKPVAQGSAVEATFISTWNTENAGSSATKQIRLPLEASGGYNFTVDWGDGSTSQITSSSDPDKLHTYTSTGIYTIKITGQIDGFGFISIGEDNKKLVDISQWGQVKFHNSGYVFSNIDLVAFSASDTPDLIGLTNMSSMFQGASNFNQDLNNWNVSNVTNMSSVFYDATSFNGNISNWNVSKVTKMNNMFRSADAFNQDISNWDVSSVTDMNWMFYSANLFNQNIGSWNVGNVTDMSLMFYFTSFNKDISGWNVSSVTNMKQMFNGNSSFNQDLSSWNVSNVTNMQSMFHSTSSFNQDISGWIVSNVTNMSSIFENATSFSQDLTAWGTNGSTALCTNIASKPVNFDLNAGVITLPCSW